MTCGTWSTTQDRWGQRAVRHPGALSLIGEPVTFGVHPEDYQDFMRRHGFQIVDLALASELQARVRAAMLERWSTTRCTCCAPSGCDYGLGSDRGSPNHGSTLFSKRVMAQIRSPASVRTMRPTPWRTSVGPRRYAPNAGCPLALVGDEVKPPAGAEQVGEEARHHVSALVLERHRWHRDEDVVSQQGHHRVEVGGLVGPDERRHDGVLRSRGSDRWQFAVDGR